MSLVYIGITFKIMLSLHFSVKLEISLLNYQEVYLSLLDIHT